MDFDLHPDVIRHLDDVIRQSEDVKGHIRVQITSIYIHIWM